VPAGRARGRREGVPPRTATSILRKVAVQAPTRWRATGNEALAAEHVAAPKIFDLLEKTADSDSARRSFVPMQLKHAVRKHAFQEENVVSAMKRYRGYVKQYLFDLIELARSDMAWLRKVL
jgi:hypothetical protein